ncbi:hypothetical protein RB653_009368 [Dictyostelium firmibasis]|uniref:Rho-GAP domain-containing protein n=1 Tax=Dictyostelium firmibasis TaxID=79012 RepID=A0AAN7U1N5_9MYCE
MATPVSLSQVEKKTIESILTNKKEEGKLITKCTILNEKKKKLEIKTLILSSNRIFLFTDSKGKLSAEHHYLDITEISSQSENDVTIKFKNQSMMKMNLDASEVLKTLYSILMSTFPGIKIGKTIIFNITPVNRIASIFQATSFKDIQGCGSFNLTYRSVCDHIGVQPLSSILWDIENLYPFNQVREFNLAEIYQYSFTDLKAILLSLSYNTYFHSFQSNGKLSNEDLNLLAEVFKENTSLQQLTITNSQASKEPIITLLQNVAENKGLHLNYINLNNNSLENKGILTLGSSIQTFSSGLTYLNIENTSCSGKGLEAMFSCLAVNSVVCGSMTYLNISNNKLESYGTTGLCRFLSKATALQQLIISNTSPVYSCLKTSSSSIQILDFSGNKSTTTKEGVIDILSFFKQMSQLQNVNLSRIQTTADDLKLLFSPATSLLKCANVDLSENDLGDSGIIKLCEIMYPNSNLRHLSIDGNFKTRTKLRARAIEALINLIDDNTSIESLSLASGSGKYQLKSDLMPLLLSLLKNQSLVKLDVSGNGIGDSGALAISKILWKNQTLKSLKCDGNDFSYTALKMIKSSIKRNEKSLTILPLPLSDIATILKNDNGSLSHEKIIKTIQDLQNSIVNNYPNNIQPIDISSGGLTPTKQQPGSSSGVIKKPIGPPSTPTKNSNPGFQTLPKRPTRGPLYPGRAITPASTDKAQTNAATIELPSLVSRSIDLLIEQGISSVGIFRTCASATALKKIKTRFEAGEDVDLKAEGVDVDTVAGVLKSYFRELPIPIFPENLHESFYQAMRQPSNEERIQSLKEIIDQLSPLECKMIKKLFHLLHLISLEKDVNMMSPENIAICWAPTFFRSFASELLPINSFMIVNYFDIFDPENKPISSDNSGDAETDSTVTSNSSLAASLSSPISPSTTPTKSNGASDNVLHTTVQVSRSPSHERSHTVGPTTTKRPDNNVSGNTPPLSNVAPHHNTMPSRPSASPIKRPPTMGGSLSTFAGIPLSAHTSSNSLNTTSTSNSSSNSSSGKSSSNPSPTPTPPDSPSMSYIGDGKSTLRSKRFSRVNRVSYSPVLPRAWTNESRTVSSLFQDDLDSNSDSSSSGPSL